MKLSVHLETRGLTHAEFAALIGTSQAAVTRYVLGQRIPRPSVLAKIAEVTAGAVTANDFVPFTAPTPQESAA